MSNVDHNPQTSLPKGLFVWLLSLGIWLTWSPFEGRTEGEIRFDPAFQLDAEFVGHLLLLGPLAAVLSATFRSRGDRRPLLKAWGIASLVGVLLEAGQWWVQGRSVSLDDVLAGALGAALAVFIVAALMRFGLQARTVHIGVAAVVFLSVSLVVLWQGLWPKRDLQLQSWDPGFLVLAEDEVGGKRAYRGIVREGRICTLAAGDEFCVSPGASVEQRERLVRLVEETQYVRLSAQVLSEGLQDYGPARIVTFSKDGSQRNATLG